jgi:hypothetical protein
MKQNYMHENLRLVACHIIYIEIIFNFHNLNLQEIFFNIFNLKFLRDEKIYLKIQQKVKKEQNEGLKK